MTDWRTSKQYPCPDCGHMRGIGFMPNCPHGTPPVISGVSVQVYEEDSEWCVTGHDWEKKSQGRTAKSAITKR